MLTWCNITLRRGTWIDSFAWKSFRWASAPLMPWETALSQTSHCQVAVRIGWTSSGWPSQMTRCWQDEKAEARGAGITGSSQEDVIQETRNSTPEFTFAPSWRADCILYSSVMTQAPRRGRKIGWGELFKEELSGIMRNRYVLLPCYSGSDF